MISIQKQVIFDSNMPSYAVFPTKLRIFTNHFELR